MLPYFQFPVRWSTLQAVVSPGSNPLPAAIHMKTDQKFVNVFYYLNQATWYCDFMESALYDDPVQEAVHRVI